MRAVRFSPRNLRFRESALRREVFRFPLYRLEDGLRVALLAHSVLFMAGGRAFPVGLPYSFPYRRPRTLDAAVHIQ